MIATWRLVGETSHYQVARCTVCIFTQPPTTDRRLRSVAEKIAASGQRNLTRGRIAAVHESFKSPAPASGPHDFAPTPRTPCVDRFTRFCTVQHKDGHWLGPSMGWVGLGWVAFSGTCWVGLNEKYCGIVAEYCKTHTFHCP